MEKITLKGNYSKNDMSKILIADVLYSNGNLFLHRDFSTLSNNPLSKARKYTISWKYKNDVRKIKDIENVKLKDVKLILDYLSNFDINLNQPKEKLLRDKNVNAWRQVITSINNKDDLVKLSKLYRVLND